MTEGRNITNEKKTSRFAIRNIRQYVVNYAKNCRFLFLKMYTI